MRSVNGTILARRSAETALSKHVRHTARATLPQCLFTTLAAGFKIQFRKELTKQPLCDMMLKRDEVAMLKEAIRQDYFFEMFFDDLPVWG